MFMEYFRHILSLLPILGGLESYFAIASGKRTESKQTISIWQTAKVSNHSGNHADVCCPIITLVLGLRGWRLYYFLAESI